MGEAPDGEMRGIGREEGGDGEGGGWDAEGKNERRGRAHSHEPYGRGRTRGGEKIADHITCWDVFYKEPQLSIFIAQNIIVSCNYCAKHKNIY
jgi:hypothetical protein